MKDIVIEVEAAVDAGIEEELINLGAKCDADLEHLPFKEFQINIIPNKELEKQIEQELIQEEVDRRLAILPYSPSMTERTQIFNEVRSRIRAGKNRMNKLLTSIEIEFTKEGLKLKSEFCYSAELVINKKKFNMQDEDLDIKIKDIELFREGSEEAALHELQDNVWLIFGILAFMQTTKEEVKSTRVKREPSVRSSNNNKKKSSSKKKKSNKTYLYNKVYKLNKDTLTRATTKVAAEEGIKDSKRTYHVASWYVRGHWRHYKNGKDIWIEAQFRHPQKEVKEDKEQKIYKITKL